MRDAEMNRSLGPLAKYYTTPEIAAVLRNLGGEEGVGETNAVNRMLLKTSGLVQYNQTVLSPVTHVRNGTGNLAILAANGHYRVGKAAEAWKAMRAPAGKPGEFAERAARYAELNVVGDSFNANLIREQIRRSGYMENIFGKALKKTNELYAMEDDFFKVIGFDLIARKTNEGRGGIRVFFVSRGGVFSLLAVLSAAVSRVAPLRRRGKFFRCSRSCPGILPTFPRCSRPTPSRRPGRCSARRFAGDMRTARRRVFSFAKRRPTTASGTAPATRRAASPRATRRCSARPASGMCTFVTGCTRC